MTDAVPRRGDIWLADLPGDKVRPIVVMTRLSVIRHLHSVIAAPVTSTIRGIPTEVRLTADDGLLRESAANFDTLQLVSRSRLIRQIGVLSEQGIGDACRALRFAVGC
jgi:mRNA interferase MazF